MRPLCKQSTAIQITGQLHRVMTMKWKCQELQFLLRPLEAESKNEPVLLDPHYKMTTERNVVTAWSLQLIIPFKTIIQGVNFFCKGMAALSDSKLRVDC